MTRIGINPARGKHSAYRPAPVTIALLTYIPDLSGYFEDRLQILKLVLSSLRENTPPPYDLMVFDNNSCNQVVDFLRTQQRAGLIDFLIASKENIGKIGALRILFESAPGDVIAYSDDDILFYPGWLQAQLEILNHFPHVGMVSGVPVRDAAQRARRSLDSLIAEGYDGISITNERSIPDEWERDWAVSTGRDPQQHLENTRQHEDVVLRNQTTDQQYLEAIGSANHFQFVTPKQVILQALPSHWTGKLMGHMVELDEAIDHLGYLRLSTTQRYTRHLGNILSPEVLNETCHMGLITTESDADQAKTQTQLRQRHWSLRIPGIRRLYMAVYKRLFDLLYR